MANISHRVHGIKVITQNIDRIHSKTSLSSDKLIEVHGRLGKVSTINHFYDLIFFCSIDVLVKIVNILPKYH